MSNPEAKTQLEKNEEERAKYQIIRSPAKTIISINSISNNSRILRNNNYGISCLDDDETDALVEKFENYGNTPPRTRISRKNRDWDRKQKFETKKNVTVEGAVPIRKGGSRMCRSRVQRRNTMDCAILNELFINEETKRTDKRALGLLRESERDIKLSLATTNFANSANVPTNRTSLHENPVRNSGAQVAAPAGLYSNESPVKSNNSILRQPISNSNVGVPTLIESCNRYMSVSSRPIGCRSSAPASAFALNNFNRMICPTAAFKSTDTQKKNARKEFHETFANLIKLGNTDRQDTKLSHEDTTWQTELKDLIWLELQAWQADRTLEQQDKFLFTARQSVPDLLTQIINYKFEPKYRNDGSIISTDSGLGSETASSAASASTDGFKFNHCTGCYSLYCKDCACQQSLALKEVEELLTKLEAAESLYPSSQQMGVFHPIYKSELFIGRVKAMCLWYNTTRHHRLKLIILGKILSRLQSNKFNWPVQTSVNESSSSSHDNDSSADISATACKKTVSNDSPGAQCQKKRTTVPKVQFDLNGVNPSTNESPSESISSNESAVNEPFNDQINDSPIVGNYEKCVNNLNIYNVQPLLHISYDNIEYSTKLYRKYIENILKSRGLANSLDFIHNLHNNVLYKAKITLEKPGTKMPVESESSDDSDSEDEEDDFDLEPEIEEEQIEELRRYGYWSEEAKSLNLPSYVPSFIFLSVIPLEVIHEFLRMRLETRPTKPNPLSLEQLMKELREGLTISLTQRERFQRHITTALTENPAELEKYKAILNQFDSTVKKVLELYLNYVDQWVLVAAPETHKKSALDQEWVFTKLVSPMVPGMHTLAARKFCLIISNLLNDISDRLVKRAIELDGQLDGQIEENEDAELMDEAKKWQLLTICRETQALFTNERERCMKVLYFAKVFCRDIEEPDFHREHYKEYLSRQQFNELICPVIKEAFKLLQIDILDVRSKLIKIIERVQDRCNIKNMLELDEQDKISILSRSREILHQGYKFGFEYQKDVIRLFEQKIMSKDKNFELDLSLGIVTFAKMWMQFVNERCERGRGVRPRWANHGLEYLIFACDPQITKHLDEKQFEDLKSKMDNCISHVIGIVSEPAERIKKKASPRTRKTSSPATSRSRTPTRASPMSAGIVATQQKFLLPQFSLKEEYKHSTSTDSTDFPTDDYSPISPIQFVVPKLLLNSNESLALRQIRVRDAVNHLDMQIEDNLKQRNLIGQVKSLNSLDKVQIRARSVNFRWHRGIKIGQGRFGKVYTAVNNTNGELMAMKEIQIQPGETRMLKNVAEELKILEGITHRNLVRYYGIEIHREELLIFMELCSEGTLESLVELSAGGLHEGLTRRFTAQLLSGVAELHKHGIVHRDIKSANIFIVDGANSLKLGDFGSAVKIQAHTTVPGELQGYVGTQSYMAPEVFTKTNSDGHGRAADIWSVGCVVIEMASGKRPWSQFDSNFQIMFKVGMGEIPEIPASLSQEGHEFVEYCLQHDPKLRWTAIELLEHNFCKVELDSDLEDNDSRNDNQGRRSFRKNKRL